jgi:diacylglycerol kinase family enzyme
MWAGIGFGAASARSVSLKEKRALGSWAYVLSTTKSAYRYSGTDVCLNLDGKVVEVNTPFIVVSNIQLYGGMVEIGAKARVNDAKLGVCIFKGGNFFTFV